MISSIVYIVRWCGVPIPLRPIDKVVDKWKSRATAAGPDYTFGVQNPLKDWATFAQAAGDSWRAGVTDAAGRDAYRKGVAKAGTPKWQRKAVDLGSRRFPEGVTAGAPDYKAEFAPFYDALSKIDLPPRGARGDPKNLERVRVIMQTLRAVKTGAGAPVTR
jgi:hypothetical protein